MKHLPLMVLAALLTATGAGVTFLVAVPAESEGESEITALCERYSSAYKARDAAAIASLFSGRNVVLMPPNVPAAVGPEAIKSRWRIARLIWNSNR